MTFGGKDTKTTDHNEDEEQVDIIQNQIEHYLFSSLKGVNGFISDTRKQFPDKQVISKDNHELIEKVNPEFAGTLSNLFFSQNNPF